jgi:hypothetical protein
MYSNEIYRNTLKSYRSILNNNNQQEDSYINLVHHFYDPNAQYICSTINSVCLLPNAKAFAISYFDQAIKEYWHDKAIAFGKLGKALHLLQDMAVPSHVHRANHFQQSVLWKNGYEWWVARHWDWDDSRSANNWKYQGFFT